MPATVVLAFSGGLDTSYCVPRLKELGYRVHTLFVDTGGVTPQAVRGIERRAMELGAWRHTTHDASDQLWDDFVVPFVMGGECYQSQYPLLCSDRYAIAGAMAKLAIETSADAVGHGCTAMGNDQIRFDNSLRCLTDLPVLAPIRDLQNTTGEPRAYEIDYLESRGFCVPSDVKRYTINENILGATISGSEIDLYRSPEQGARRLTAPIDTWPDTPTFATLRFEKGRCVALDGQALSGKVMLRDLNRRFGECGVGRGIYSGDTIIGLKGRIVFEAPGLTALLTAHRALEEVSITKEQNTFKPVAARKWTELMYSGFYYEPLRLDLERLIYSTQEHVTGTVTVEAFSACCCAVAIDAERPLQLPDALYAQSASWSADEAEGFIKILGNSTATSALRQRSCAQEDISVA